MNRRSTTQRKASPAAKSRYVAFAAVAAMAFMLCLTINYRAFSELSREVDENQNLSWQIQNLTSENLDLQDEIHSLKNDPQAIMREARKMGVAPPRGRDSKVPVQANK